MATLFDDDGSDGEGQLTINQSYADKYDKWREKEEYQKRKLIVCYALVTRFSDI